MSLPSYSGRARLLHGPYPPTLFTINNDILQEYDSDEHESWSEDDDDVSFVDQTRENDEKNLDTQKHIFKLRYT